MLITTKFAPPRLTRTPVRREAAIGQLSSGLSRALTLVRAPAGFGKTSLLTAWREQLLARNTIVAWLTLDQDDNDETRFIEYLSGTLAAALGPLVDDTPEFGHAGKLVSVRVHLTSIINAIDKIEREVILILDDFEKIADPKVHELFAFLLRHIPANLHVFAATRSDPPLPLASLRASDQLVEITVESMRFGVADTQIFLANAMSATFSPDEVRALHDATEGWAAGLQLATLAMPAYPDVHGLIAAFARHSRVLSEYLAENVIAQVPAATLDFMIRTSIVDRLSSSLCAALAGVADAAGMLEWLVRHNMFLQPLDEEGHWYCYHGLFAEFLRGQLRRRMRDECAALHLRAAHWYSEHGLWAEAVRHAIDAQRGDLAADWLERCALGELRSGRVRNFLGWIEKLPQEILRRRYSLRIAQIWALILTVQTSQARKLVKEVDAELVAAPPPEADELRRTLRTQCVSIMSMQDRITEALELGKRVWLERFPGGQKPRQGFDWTDEAFLNAMLHLQRKSGDLDAARQLAIFYRPNRDEAQNLMMTSYRAGLLAALEVRESQSRAAARRLELALEVCETHAGRRSATATFLAASLSGIYYDEDRLDEVEELLANRRDVIDEVCFIEPTQTAYLALARIRIAKGQPQAARTILDHVETLAERRGWLSLAAACDGERVRLNLLEDQIPAAEQSLQRLEAVARQIGQIERERVDVALMAVAARARVLMHRHDFIAARALLGDALVRATKQGNAATHQEIAALRVLLAMAHNGAGNPDAARACLAEVLAVAAPQNMVRLLADEAAIVPILAAQLGPEGQGSPHANYYWRLARALEIDAPIASGEVADDDSPRPDGPNPNALSRRESVVLGLLARNLSNKQIARELFITPETVKWHLKNVYQKLGVADRRQAAQAGRQLLG